MCRYSWGKLDDYKLNVVRAGAAESGGAPKKCPEKFALFQNEDTANKNETWLQNKFCL
jgi:hypothetical protein